MNKTRKNVYGPLCALALIALLLLVVGCRESADESPNDDPVDQQNIDPYPPGQFDSPDSRGPYEVGVTTVVYIDYDRFMEYGQIPRMLLTEIWYPIESAGTQINTLADMLGPLPQWGDQVGSLLYGDEFDDLMDLSTTAWRDEEPIVPDHPFPVVLFSHGLSAIRFQNYTLCEHLASHGFVIIAPDHYDNAIFANIPDHFLIFNPLSILTSEYERPRDVRFLVEQITRRSELDQDFLQGLVDPERIGLSGHSYGGLTCYLGAVRVPEIKSIAPINPALLKPMPPGFDTPILLLVGETDNVISRIFDSRVRTVEDFTRYTGDKAYIMLKNSGHYSATDACELLPPWLFPPSMTGCGGTMVESELANHILASYMTAFFSVTLKQDLRYKSYLSKNSYPQYMNYTFEWDRGK